MHLSHEPIREREATPQALDPVIQRSHAVRCLHDVVSQDTGSAPRFVQHEVGKRRLCTFDLRREHRFLAHVSVDEIRCVGQKLGHRVEPPQSRRRRLERSSQPPPEDPRRARVGEVRG